MQKGGPITPNGVEKLWHGLKKLEGILIVSSIT